LTRNGPARKLSFDDPGDNPNFDPSIKIANGRVSGPAAARLSKSFLDTEKQGYPNGFIEHRNPADGAVTMGLTLDANSMKTENQAMFEVGGFTSARKFLLDECARIDREGASPLPQRPIEAGNAIAGEATVVSTSTLTINGQTIALQGVDGVGGTYAEQFRAFLREQGGRVNCERAADRSYRCKTASNVDISTAVLFNGSGRAHIDAPEELKRAEQSARERRVGLWTSAQ
jgi:hypothetical protein